MRAIVIKIKRSHESVKIIPNILYPLISRLMDTEAKTADTKETKEVPDTEMTTEETKPASSPEIDEKLIENHEGL